MSDGRSLAGASLAEKGSLFCHSPAVYFLARPWQGSAAVYTWFASFLAIELADLQVDNSQATQAPE